MNTNEKFIGAVGLGYWGKNILRVLHELSVVHTACDFDLEIIKKRKAQYASVNYTASFSNILQNPEIKAIAIATPAATHYELVRKSLLADKDVFVEKPLALTFEQGEELVQLAAERHRQLMVGHILQYHPAIARLKELVDSGELGRIEYLYSNRLNIGKLRVEENILWSFAPHDISVILMILGQKPISVSAFGGDYLNRGVYDTTLTTLDFRNGVKGHIFVSWLHPYKEQKLIVVGSKAMAVFDDVSDEKLFVYPHQIQWKNGSIPIAKKSDYRVILFEKGEPLKLELAHFIECVKKRKAPKTNGPEGLRVLRVLELAEKSLLAGKAITVARKPIDYFIHESSYVDKNVRIGDGTKIWHYTHILTKSSVGKKCVIGQNVMIGPDVILGDRCKIQNNVSIYKGVTLEEDVFCGPSCVFTNVYNPRAFVERKDEFRPTLVKKGASIGANATIVCGVTVGKYAVIGAGAVVRSDVPDQAIFVGVPARQIGWACKCGVTLRFEQNKAICGKCANVYELRDEKTVLLQPDVE